MPSERIKIRAGRLCTIRQLLAALVGVAALNGNAEAQNCITLQQGMSEAGSSRYGPDSHAPGSTVIDKPGRYCLDADLRVWPLLALHSGRAEAI